MTQKAQVLHILGTPRAEGTPRLVLDWLSDKTVLQEVLFLENKPADLVSMFDAAGVKVSYRSKTLSLNIMLRVFVLPFVVWKYCKKHKPERVISWNQGFGYLVALGAKLAGINTIMIHAGCASEIHPKWGTTYHKFTSKVISFCNATLVCASEHIRNSYIKAGYEGRVRLRVVYNCVDLSKFQFSGNYDRKQQCIYVANLEETKDHKSLIKAWEKVNAELPDAQLLCVGRGDLHEILEKYAESKKLSESITFTGFRTDIPQLLNESKVFVFTSTHKEGFGTVLLEALSCGLKVVAFSEPAPNEVLKNGEYGVLVENRDVDVLADTLVSALVSPLSKDEIRHNIQYAEEFSVKNMIQGYLKQ